MSAINPKPRDLHGVVLKLDGDSARLRRDDEATVVGAELDHHFFIVCCAVGVRDHIMRDGYTLHTRTLTFFCDRRSLCARMLS